MNRNPQSALIIVYAAFITIAGYFTLALPHCLREARDCFTSPLLAPWRYRVLSIYLERLISPDGQPPGMITADVAIHTVCVLVVYFGLYIWLSKWTDRKSASIGILILLGTWMYAYYLYYRSVTTVIEMACIVPALLALNRRLWMYTALVILASLNRETGVFLAVAWAAYHADEWRTRRYWFSLSILGIAYAAVTAALHMSLGSAEHVLGLAGTLEYNLGQIGGALSINAFLLPVWFMAITGYRRAPKALQRLALVGLLSFGAIVVGGSWTETPRLTLAVYPLILPVILYQGV